MFTLLAVWVAKKPPAFMNCQHKHLLLSMCVYIIYSMGGAIAVHTAERDLIPSLAGLIVIDVVEGRQ